MTVSEQMGLRPVDLNKPPPPPATVSSDPTQPFRPASAENDATGEKLATGDLPAVQLTEEQEGDKFKGQSATAIAVDNASKLDTIVSNGDPGGNADAQQSVETVAAAAQAGIETPEMKAAAEQAKSAAAIAAGAETSEQREKRLAAEKKAKNAKLQAEKRARKPKRPKGRAQTQPKPAAKSTVIAKASTAPKAKAKTRKK